MTQFYLQPERANDTWSLPDAEVFYMSESDVESADWADADGDRLEPGYYWWACFPGCMPESEPNGPFPTEAAAIADAQDFD